MSMIKSFFYVMALLTFSLPSYSAEILAQTQRPSIKIGMSTALSGPAQELGQDIKLGVETYFASVNAAGGVAGRNLELIALDDKYEPDHAGQNMRKLVENEQVLAVVGNVGTPTAMVTVPIANEKKILLFGAFTGSNVLRKSPPDRYVINLRASYEQETASMVKGLLSAGIKAEEIGFFLQNDSYGDSGYQGAIKALKGLGFSNTERLTVARYVRNTLNVEEGLARFLSDEKPPKAIIMVGAYAPVAKFIHLAKKEFPKTIFLNVSFVGSAALARMLGKESENVIVTQVIPSPNAELPAVQSYRQDMKKYSKGATIGYGSLEGYLDAKLFVAGLVQASVTNQLTREGIIDTFEKMNNIDIGIGLKISFDKNNHQALHTVWPTIINNGQFMSLNWPEIKNIRW